MQCRSRFQRALIRNITPTRLVSLQPDVKPDVAGGSEHINLKVTGSVSFLPTIISLDRQGHPLSMTAYTAIGVYQAGWLSGTLQDKEEHTVEKVDDCLL